MKIDWEKLDAEGLKYTGIKSAKQALEKILGEEGIKEAVKHSISFKPGWDLAVGCLRDIESKRATEIAYEIYKISPDEKEREMAVYLIREIADPISLAWVEEFLNDPLVEGWGICLLDYLIWRDNVDAKSEQVKHLLEVAENHSSEYVRDQLIWIREVIANKES